MIDIGAPHRSVRDVEPMWRGRKTDSDGRVLGTRSLLVLSLACLVLTGAVVPVAAGVGSAAETPGSPPAATAGPVTLTEPTSARSDCAGGGSAPARTGQVDRDGRLPEPLRAIGVASAHASGYTGEGAVVGIVDWGFDIEGTEIEDSVSETVDLTGEREPTPIERSHGTAVAEVLTTVAPDADLVLISVEPSPESVRSALDRLDPATEPTGAVDADDIDLLVLPFGDERAGAPIDGTNELDWRVSRFVTQTDTPVFVAAGNTPDHSWSDTYDPGAEGYHTFASGKTWQPIGRTADLRFHWHAPDPNATSFTVELVALADGKPVSPDDPLLEKTIEFDDVPGQVDTLGITGDHDALAVRIRSESADSRARLALFGSRPLSFARTRTSILSPATAHESIAVGVATPEGEQVETSVAGPTIDGRRGLDLVAPARIETTTRGVFAGSSGSVPVVGGTAALVAAESDFGHGALERRLFETASPGPEQPNSELGYGVVNASRAVRSLSPVGRVLFLSDRLGTYRSPLRAVPYSGIVQPVEWGLSTLFRYGQSVDWSGAC